MVNKHSAVGRVLVVGAALALAACNLSADPPQPTPPTETIPTLTAPPADANSDGVPTALPGMITAPANTGGLPTRTPSGALDPNSSVTTAAPGNLTPAPANPNAPAAGTNVSTPTVVITSPPANGTFAGSVLTIGGVAGGIAEQAFYVSLFNADGTLINDATITLTSGDYTRVVTWTATLGTLGRTGAARLEARTINGTLLNTVTLTLQ